MDASDGETLESPIMADCVVAYASSQRRARIVTGLFTFGIFLSVALLLFDAHQFQLMGRIIGNEEVTQREIELSNNWEILLGAIGLIWYPSLVVTFLMWTHRAHRNLPALGATELRFSPRGAVGWYFVPLLNLFKPYQVMREIYNASEPITSLEGGSDRRRQNAPMIVKLWWALFLFMGFIGNAVTRESFRAETPEDYQVLAAASIVDSTLSIFATVAAIWLVWSITRRQEARAALLDLAT